MTRRADVKRQTAETSILVSMDLDGTGKADIRTGIGFFDHMLHQIARHGQIDLTVMCDGDLHIDGHHSVEDIGIAMGQCLAKALGDKAGITRFGSAYVPLDEALSRTVLDISGRPYLVWNVDFTAAMIGELDTQLPREFFLALATMPALRFTLTICAASMRTISASPSLNPSAAQCAWPASTILAPATLSRLQRVCYENSHR